MKDSAHTMLRGWPRHDGRKGVRNVVVTIYLVECAHHVARRITGAFSPNEVHLVGFPGCYPSKYAALMLERVATHPNVGAVLIVSLGCESFDRRALGEAVAASGRPVETLVIQECGGTKATIGRGIDWIEEVLPRMRAADAEPMRVDELIIGTICGGSDATSGITANPAVGRCLDRFIAEGGTAIFEETGELIGCEHFMAQRAATSELGNRIVDTVAKAARYYETLGHGSFATGNAEGGLTTIEEKSLGAYAKSGQSPIVGILKPGDIPTRAGLHLLDVVPDGPVRFGYPNIADNAEIVELIACGCHMILFTTGRGSVVGSAVAPVIKICANPTTYAHLHEDMDIDAGSILRGESDLEGVGEDIFARILDTGRGLPTASESLGHQEFVLTYKWFESPPHTACGHTSRG